VSTKSVNQDMIMRSDCWLLPNQHFFIIEKASYIQWNDNDVHIVQ
jgi:hypothetical protein